MFLVYTYFVSGLKNINSLLNIHQFGLKILHSGLKILQSTLKII